MRPFEHYETMTLDEIKALPVKALAADDCALSAVVHVAEHADLACGDRGMGLRYSGLAFDWIKLKPDGKGLHWGGGMGGTRANAEPCLLARIGKPLRLDEGVHSVIMTPVGEHSEKPDEAYARMEQLFSGPRLELFARQPRDGWLTWGNEIARDQAPKPQAPAAETWDSMWSRPFDHGKLDGGGGAP